MLSMMLGSRRMLVKLALLGCFVVAALGTGGTDAGNPASDLNPRPSQVDIQFSEPGERRLGNEPDLGQERGVLLDRKIFVAGIP